MDPSESIRVLVVDDQELLRDGLTAAGYLLKNLPAGNAKSSAWWPVGASNRD